MIEEKKCKCFECGKVMIRESNFGVDWVMQVSTKGDCRYFCSEDCVENALARVKRK